MRGNGLKLCQGKLRLDIRKNLLMNHPDQKANRILGCIRRSVTSRLTKVILTLCSALVSPHLQYCIHFWSPQQKKDMEQLEQVQRRTMKMTGGLDHLPSRGQAERAGALQPGEEKALGRPYSGLPVPEGAYRKAEERLFIRACSDRTRGKGCKLEEGRVRLDVRDKFFIVSVVRH